MPKYNIMRCPFCKSIWVIRSDIVVSCSKCKRRFDYPGKEVEPERAEVEFSGFTPLKKWLLKANKVSRQNDSITLKEVIRIVPQKKE